MSLAVVSEHTDDERDVIERLRGAREQIDAELSKVIIGQKRVIEELLIGLFSGGGKSMQLGRRGEAQSFPFSTFPAYLEERQGAAADAWLERAEEMLSFLHV